ncbi:hypothetical protein L208DRAFT_1400080 [Tricholoma matsutake]|nr:hypothetical protein L208DRAFT_1400080 [Tricholoma matsutake 945]
MTSPTCGELGALICALQSTPPHLPLKIYIQQKTILSEITINLARNEDSDWAHTNNKNLYKSLVSNLCQRSAPTKLQQWSTTTPADRKATAQHLAKAALEKPQCNEIDISTDCKWTLAGMKLKNGTQHSLYQGITKWKLANKSR